MSPPAGALRSPRKQKDAWVAAGMACDVADVAAGAEAEISLNFLAGYASYRPTRPISRLEHAGISFAGPAVQIVTSLAVLLVMGVNPLVRDGVLYVHGFGDNVLMPWAVSSWIAMVPTIVVIILMKWLLNDAYGVVPHLLEAIGVPEVRVVIYDEQRGLVGHGAAWTLHPNGPDVQDTSSRSAAPMASTASTGRRR